MKVRKDKHHIVHYGLEWSLRPQAKQIRETPSLIPETPRDFHDYIHESVPAIPLLGYHALLHTLSRFEPTNDTIQTLDSLMTAIEYAEHHPKAHDIERDLARLAINALDLQRPFILELEQMKRRKHIA